MKWSEFFTSSIGKKFIMSLTGIFLISFLVVHVGINACIWANDGGQMFNLASHFMATTIVIRIVEVGLFAGLLLHIVQGLVLEVQNRSRRKTGYAVPMGNKGSKWYSRSMGLLGTLFFFFWSCISLISGCLPVLQNCRLLIIMEKRWPINLRKLYGYFRIRWT